MQSMLGVVFDVVGEEGGGTLLSDDDKGVVSCGWARAGLGLTGGGIFVRMGDVLCEAVSV